MVLAAVDPVVSRAGAKRGRRAVDSIALFHVTAGDRLWSPARNLVFDAYQRFMPRPVSRFPAVIIDIDERSLAAVRPLAMAAHASGPVDRGDAPPRRAGRRDRYHHAGSGRSVAELSGGPAGLSPALRDALAQLPSNDAVLAKTLRQVPSVIARAALATAKRREILLPQPNPGDHRRRIAAASSAVVPGGACQYSGDRSGGHGPRLCQRYADSDGAVRVMPLMIAVSGAPAPALAVGNFARRDGRETLQRAQRPERRGRRANRRLVHSHRRRRPHAALLFAGLRGAANFRGGDSERRSQARRLANQVAIIGATAVGVADVAATPARRAWTASRSKPNSWKIFLKEAACGGRLRRDGGNCWRCSRSACR